MAASGKRRDLVIGQVWLLKAWDVEALGGGETTGSSTVDLVSTASSSAARCSAHIKVTSLTLALSGTSCAQEELCLLCNPRTGRPLNTQPLHVHKFVVRLHAGSTDGPGQHWGKS
jgi:hypothetical protein